MDSEKEIQELRKQVKLLSSQIDSVERKFNIHRHLGSDLTQQISVDSLKGSILTDPAGSNTDIQFNDSGVFGGSDYLTWDKVNRIQTVNGTLNVFTGNLAVSDGDVLVSKSWVTSSASYTPSASGTATLNLTNSNEHRITMPAGNITIALSNIPVSPASMKFMVSITQDGTGSRTVTWFTTIRWAGGTAPTLTTTASKRDTFGFIRTGSNTYDGFVIGQSL